MILLNSLMILTKDCQACTCRNQSLVNVIRDFRQINRMADELSPYKQERYYKAQHAFVNFNLKPMQNICII